MNHCRLPDKLLPPALHSCLLRDNGLISLSAQLQVRWEGGESAVCTGSTLAGRVAAAGGT